MLPLPRAANNAATKNRSTDEAAVKKEAANGVTAKNKTAVNAGNANIKIFSYL
jgi:hypothetical protein